MKIHEIRVIAKTWGVDASVGRSKQDIIRDIQVSEGNSPLHPKAYSYLLIFPDIRMRHLKKP
jgi:hypothetical protein